jgi:type IV secretion system protein VirB4
MLDDIYRLPFAMQVTQSFAFVDRGPAQERMDLALRRMRSADDAAVSLRTELSAAKDDVAAGRAGFGEHHLTIMVTSRQSRKPRSGGIGEVQAALAECGFAVVREELGLEAAFWAQFPGNFDYIARRALVSSANFAGFASAHNFPVGKPTAITGATRSPCSRRRRPVPISSISTAATLATSRSSVRRDRARPSCWLPARPGARYNPRIVFFDKDRGAEIFLRAIGGTYDTLRPGKPTR